ncbi:MAG TPA: hypothetical protein VHY08_06065 [Bacillota bacterium]|nr:hypothetical protein [Bacillota bacterium]
MEKGPNIKINPERSSKPETPPQPVTVMPVKTESVSDFVYGAHEIGSTDFSFEFELNRNNILQGIILAEVLGKPKGSRRYRR